MSVEGSCHEFGHHPEGSDIAPRRSKVTGVNMSIMQYIEGEDDTPNKGFMLYNHLSKIEVVEGVN